ncbi:hypothetical protein [Massilia antarctica]|uniref:hypothetical protein n=1 Tax=Massilia antarctica TaxID=2765360 RepID=UPI0006BB7EB1|nr:hypothetical protein [Massilia sp. H27-R4]MCY0911967.1 hypothetical protein [Massilia sp. H27-R4]
MTLISPNPYAAPKASFEAWNGAQCAYESTQCWRQEDILIAPVDAYLPPRCIKCNKPASMDSPRAYMWHHPGWYALIPILVYMVACLFVRKRAELVLGLCDEHRRRRRHRSMAAHAVGAFGAIALLGAVFLGKFWLAYPAGVLILMSAALALSGQHLLRPVHITEQEIHLKGCGSAFLDSLPPRCHT